MPSRNCVVHVSLLRNVFPGINTIIILSFSTNISIVRQCMPCPTNTIDKIEVAITLSMIKHQRAHPCRPRPETKHHHVHHRTHLDFVIHRITHRWSLEHNPLFLAKRVLPCLFFSKLHSSLYCAKRLHVLINLSLIR